MQNGIENSIKYIKVYKCGYCINDLGLLYKEYKIGAKAKFYANCILIKHNTLGYILVDTGYSESIKQKSFKKMIYNTLNYTVISNKDTINYQLQKDGISPDSINYVIISHFHPDHIGALKYFNNARFITSLNLFKLSMKKTLVFKEDIPSDFVDRLIDIDNKRSINNNYFKSLIDIFDDKSIFIIQIDGHTKGQIGVLIPSKKVIFVADSCWKKGEILGDLHIKFVPRLIHESIKDYLYTQKCIKKFLDENDTFYLLCSHDEV